MTTLAPEPTATGHDTGDELAHAICMCDEDTALCGADVAGGERVMPGEDVTYCVVCLDLYEQPCPRCGE